MSLNWRQKRAWRALFDEAYYRTTYLDLPVENVDPFQHFISIGWLEDRNPRPGFDLSKYKQWVLENAPEAHPMRDLWRLHDGRAAAEKHLECLMFDGSVPTVKNLPKMRIGVHFHAFYPEIVSDFLPSARFFPAGTRFVITACRKADVEFIENLVADTFANNDLAMQFSVRLVENRGRDIGPFLVGCSDLWKMTDLILHLHSKVSPHVDWGIDWRSYLYDHCLDPH